MTTTDSQELDSSTLANMPLFSMSNMDTFESEIRESERRNNNDRLIDMNIQLAELKQRADGRNYEDLERRHSFATWFLVVFLVYSILATVMWIDSYAHYRDAVRRSPVVEGR